MMTSAGIPLFSCENLSLDLGGREVLRDIGFELRAGEVLGIIGPNGAGKTSLFEVLSGRYRPKSGKVIFQGRDITRAPCSSVPVLASGELIRRHLCLKT